MQEVEIGKLADIADGDYQVFAVDKLEVGIFRTGSKVLAYENVCPHAGGPVCQGKIFNQVEEVITPDKKSAGLRFGKQRHIVCPWHGYEFDLATGCHPGDPSMQPHPSSGRGPQRAHLCQHRLIALDCRTMRPELDGAPRCAELTFVRVTFRRQAFRRP